MRTLGPKSGAEGLPALGTAEEFEMNNAVMELNKISNTGFIFFGYIVYGILKGLKIFLNTNLINYNASLSQGSILSKLSIYFIYNCNTILSAEGVLSQGMK
jgi:hypothetical protein